MASREGNRAPHRRNSLLSQSSLESIDHNDVPGDEEDDIAEADFSVIERDETGPKPVVDPWSNAYQHSRAAVGNVYFATKTFGRSLTSAGIGSAMFAVAGAAATSVGKGATHLARAAFAQPKLSASAPNRPAHVPPFTHQDDRRETHRRSSFDSEGFQETPMNQMPFDPAMGPIAIMGDEAADPRRGTPPGYPNHQRSFEPGTGSSTRTVIAGPAQRRRLKKAEISNKPSAPNGQSPEMTPAEDPDEPVLVGSLDRNSVDYNARHRAPAVSSYDSSPYDDQQHFFPSPVENESMATKGAEDGDLLLGGFDFDDDNVIG